MPVESQVSRCRSYPMSYLQRLHTHLHGWGPQDYAAIVAAVVSVIAAWTSVSAARRQMRWEAARALGAFRADTLDLLSMAYRVDNPTWRHVPLHKFVEAHKLWNKSLDEHAPIIGRKAYVFLLELNDLMHTVRKEALGPLGETYGGLAATEADWDEDFIASDLNRETSEKLTKCSEQLARDPSYFTR